MIDRIELDIGSQAIWHAPDQERLYVGDFFPPLFHMVDTVSRKVTASVPLRGVPGWPYATPNGKHIVVSTYIEAEDSGFAEIFDAQTLEPVSIAELPAEPFHVLDGADEASVLIVVGDGRLVRMVIATGALADLEYPLGAVMPEQVIRTVRQGGVMAKHTALLRGFAMDDAAQSPADAAELGGKGAVLVRMADLGLPVPPGFVLTTQNCAAYEAGGNQLSSALWEAVLSGIAAPEAASGRGFGQGDQRLLVSVRSGVTVSMPGMMDTVLNLELNRDGAARLAQGTGDFRFAWD